MLKMKYFKCYCIQMKSSDTYSTQYIHMLKIKYFIYTKNTYYIQMKSSGRAMGFAGRHIAGPFRWRPAGR